MGLMLTHLNGDLIRCEVQAVATAGRVHGARRIVCLIPNALLVHELAIADHCVRHLSLHGGVRVHRFGQLRLLTTHHV